MIGEDINQRILAIHTRLDHDDLESALVLTKSAIDDFPAIASFVSLQKAMEFARLANASRFTKLVLRAIRPSEKFSALLNRSLVRKFIRSNPDHVDILDARAKDLLTATFLKVLEFRQDNPYVHPVINRLAFSNPSMGRPALDQPIPHVSVKSDDILVSAIVSTYNSEKLLPACLLNLSRQSLGRNLEIIVIDSCSPQNEAAVVESFQDRIPNLRYIRTDVRETLYAAWNRGIQAATGKYVTNANTDDSHRHDGLEILAAALNAHPEADLAFADNFWTSTPNALWDDEEPSRRLIAFPDYHPSSSLHFCTLGPHPLWRRSLFDQIGLFDPTYKAAGDFEFQMRFSKCKRIAVHVPLPLSLFYQNLQGLSFADTTSAQEEAKALTHWRNSVEISQIYQVDETDPSAVSRAWAALGQRSLSIKVPWRPCKPLPDLALQCFQKALLHSPDDPWIRSCVRLLERHLSSGLRSQHVLATALPEGIYASPSGEPRPSVPPLRWFPGCATTGHGIVRAHE